MDVFLLLSDLPDEKKAVIQPAGVRLVHEMPTNGHRLLGGLLVFNGAKACGRELARFRQNPRTSLLPAFVALTNDQPAVEVPFLEAADVVARAREFPWDSLGLMADRIVTAMGALDPLDGLASSGEARFLTFLAGRRVGPVSARYTPEAPGGCIYPLARAFLGGGRRHEHECLDRLTDRGLLEKRQVSELACCPHCGDTRLNARKACTECGSTLLEAESLIHHYPCGAVFREAETRRKNGEFCPKCGKRLIHIGVDFDRPADLDLCSACGSVSEYFPLEALCLRCGERFPHDEAARRPVFEYTLAEGYPAAAGGLTGRLGGARVVDLENLRTVLARERLAAGGEGCELIRISTGQRLARITEDLFLFELLDSVRGHDIVAREREGSYLMLLREVTPAQAEAVASRLAETLGGMLPEARISVEVEEGQRQAGVCAVPPVPLAPIVFCDPPPQPSPN